MSQPPEVSLAELVTLERRPVEVIADQEYAEIGTYSFGRGIFHKTPRSGLQVGDKDLYLVKEGDFILQITFAWEGAIGLASAAEDGMHCSVRFPTFRVDEARCYPPYLLNYFRTPAGVAQLVKISPGSAGRNRVLNIKRLNEVRVPLPPLAEQRRLVARIQAVAGRIAEAQALRAAADGWAEALKAASLNVVFNESCLADWPSMAMGEVATIQSGVTLGRHLTGTTISVPYLRVANVQDGRLDLRQIKEIEIFPGELDRWLLRSGDILLTEGGDWDKLGRGTVWQGEIANCIHQNHIFCVRTDPDDFDTYFLSALIGSPYGKAYFQAASKQTTNLATINQRQLKAFRVFRPPLPEQQRIVAYLDRVQAQVDTLRAAQAASATTLAALLPAVLARAFAGDL